VDLPVGRRKSSITRSSKLEGWSDDGGDGDPGALVVDRKGGSNSLYIGAAAGCESRSDASSISALQGLLWAADHGEFCPLVHSVTDDLLGVELLSSTACDLLVEPVGAPPAGICCLCIINLHGAPSFSCNSI